MKNLYSPPVTHSFFPEKELIRRLPGQGRTYGDHVLSSKKIHINEVPQFTTIQNFFQRIRSSTSSRLLNRLMKMFEERGEKIVCTAIDSSGFTSSYANHNYSWRTGKTRK